MAVVVGAPDVHHLVKAADGELVPVVGDIGGKVGVESVGAAEHVVLQRQLLDVLVGLTGGTELLRQNVGGLQPQSAVLLIRPAPVGEQLHGVRHIAALVEGGLKEPLVVLDAVAGQIGLHLGDVAAQAELGQRVVAHLLLAVQVLVALLLVEGLRQLADIVAVVAVLRELHRVLALDDLEVARLQTLGEFLDLVAGVVDVELTGHVGAGLLQHAGQRIAQHTAAGVAHVHGAGGVGGHEFHHVLLPRQHIVLTVARTGGLDAGDGVGIPLAAQPEVQEARACQLHGGEVAALQRHVVDEGLCHLPGVHLHGLGRRQTEGGGIVAVGGILGDLHRRGHGNAGG